MKALFVNILVLITLFAAGQEKYNNQLNDILNEVVKNQVMNQLETKAARIQVAPDFFFFDEPSSFNDEIRFGEMEFGKNPNPDWNALMNLDAMQRIKFKLISNNELDSSIRIKSYNTNYLFLNIHFKIIDDQKIIEISLPDGDFTTKFKYKEDRLVHIETKRNQNYILTDISYLGDTMVRFDQYDIRKQTHQRQVQIFSDGLLRSTINYKTGKGADNLKINHREFYKYYPEGKLAKVFLEKQNGKIIDSTIYEYYRQLTVVRHYSKRQDYNINIHYNENGKLSGKDIFTSDKSYTLAYNYDKMERLITVNMSDNVRQDGSKHVLLYNNTGKLIEIKSYEKSRWGDNFDFNSQIIFNYKKSGMIASIKSANKSGIFTKEIRYDIDYLSRF